ncbi:hypothetical protein ACTWQL_11635 [Pseudalkalibacillus sp. R45]|uniref:hypothetical protein n=1 Tax=Pseudalkalibacillus sp. R45 TaxID=3457433 RepID=UPI003FCCDF4D
MMQKVPSQKRLLILFSIIAVLLLLAGYLFIVYPSLDRINTLKSQIQVEKTFIETAGKKMTTLNDDQEEVSLHTAPEGKKTDQIVLDLRKAENASKSDIQEILMQQDNDGPSDKGLIDGQESFSVLQPYTFSVLVNAPDLDSIKTFIDTVERSERFYKILSMETASGGEDTKSVTFQMEVETYHHK